MSPVVNLVPEADPTSPFDYVVVTMKTIPEINNIAEIIAPSITPGHTAIVLMQNGIYIEPPIIQAFPSCVVLSAASYIGAHERNGHVVHDDPDYYHIGVFHNPRLDPQYERQKLEGFVTVYNGSKVVNAEMVDDIQHYRWRKILWNGVYNPMCTITQLDNAAIRRMGGECTLIRPAMIEMAAIARADGYDLGPGIVNEMVNVTPMELEFRPSMLVDHDKGNPLEVEVILGNALRVGEKHDVRTPILDITYRQLRLIQARLLTGRGYMIKPTPAPVTDFFS